MATGISRRWLRASALAVLTLALSAGAVLGVATRIEQGEAKKVFKAMGNPAEDAAAIRPFAGSYSDGAHFCVLDWHVVLVRLADGGDATFTQQDAEATFAAASLSFALDGTSLTTSRTRVSELPDPSVAGWVVGYYVTEGRVLSPGDLSVGQHELSLTYTDPSGTVHDGSTFFIDAEGTGTCA